MLGKTVKPDKAKYTRMLTFKITRHVEMFTAYVQSILRRVERDLLLVKHGFWRCSQYIARYISIKYKIINN
jgi:hypothetical protein